MFLLYELVFPPSPYFTSDTMLSISLPEPTGSFVLSPFPSSFFNTMAVVSVYHLYYETIVYLLESILGVFSSH